MLKFNLCRCGTPKSPEASICRDCYREESRTASLNRVLPTCEEPECDAPVKARALCESHYRKWFRATHAPRCARCGENPITSRKRSTLCFDCYQQVRADRRAALGCSVPDCPEPHAAKGYCKRHYMALQQPRKTKYFTCIDCDEPCVNPSGRCRPCRDAFKRGRARDTCSRASCGSPTRARGLCKSHYESERTKGRPQRIWAGQVLRRTVRTMPCQTCDYSDTVVDVHRIVPAQGYILGNVVAVCPNCHRKIHLAGASPPSPITAADLDTFSSKTAEA